MKNVALIFPGQGAQKVGMGLEFYQNSPEAKAIFEQADKLFKEMSFPNASVGNPGITSNDFSLSKVIFEGPEEKLTSTAFCQPAIFTMSVAALEAFKAHPQFKNINVKLTAGHSLGEYAALYAANVMPFNEALKLVQQRAQSMEEAAKEAHGAMAAVIGFDAAKLREICQKTGAQIANYNSHEQIVITGQKEKVAAAIEAIKAAGGQKVIPLAVSGAFHSSLMASASSKFALALKAVDLKPGLVPVLSNVTGEPHTTENLRTNLAEQITHSVQWVKCVEYMVSQGVTNVIEIGPGRVLKGLIRRIDPSVTVFNIEKPQDFEALQFS